MTAHRTSSFAAALLVLVACGVVPALWPAEAVAASRGDGTYFLKDGDVVLMLGDALTQDAGFYRHIFYDDLPGTYPALVTGARDEDLRGAHLRFVNAGAAGTTAADCLRNIDVQLSRHRPTVAVVCFGTNDSYRDTVAFATSIRGIIAKLNDASVAVTLVTPPYVSTTDHPELASRAAVVSDLAGQLRRIASEARLPIADSFEAMRSYVEDGKGDLSWGDGVHPNATGKRIIADELQKAWGFGKPLVKSEAEKKPAAPAVAAMPEAGDAEWIPLDPRGDGVTPWKSEGGKAWVEGGELCATGGADVSYIAPMDAFEFEAEIKGGGGQKETIIGIAVGQSASGRLNCRARIRIYTDGDVHLDGQNTPQVRAGAGKCDVSNWVKIKVVVNKTNLSVFKDGSPIAGADISREPERQGGICFYPYGNHVVRMRNAKIRALK